MGNLLWFCFLFILPRRVIALFSVIFFYSKYLSYWKTNEAIIIKRRTCKMEELNVLSVVKFNLEFDTRTQNCDNRWFYEINKWIYVLMSLMFRYVGKCINWHNLITSFHDLVKYLLHHNSKKEILIFFRKLFNFSILSAVS